MAVLLAALPVLPAHAVIFRAGEWEGLLDVDISYGALWRFEEADAGLVALASGGERADSNVDDGTLNFDTGLASSMLRANSQLTLFRGNFCQFPRDPCRGGGVIHKYASGSHASKRALIAKSHRADS